VGPRTRTTSAAAGGGEAPFSKQTRVACGLSSGLGGCEECVGMLLPPPTVPVGPWWARVGDAAHELWQPVSRPAGVGLRNGAMLVVVVSHSLIRVDHPRTPIWAETVRPRGRRWTRLPFRPSVKLCQSTGHWPAAIPQFLLRQFTRIDQASRLLGIDSISSAPTAASRAGRTAGDRRLPKAIRPTHRRATRRPLLLV
jgi:hypothetical protein